MSDSTTSIELPAGPLRLGTRGSLLARAQSGMIAAALEAAHPGLRVELQIFKTSGDIIADRPLHEFGGKGLFTKELEQALLSGQVDFVVHSYKDVPVTMPLVEQSNLVIAAVPARESPFDVLATKQKQSIADLPPGARVGTGSLRRRCQLLATRPDLNVEPIRGNIDTRLRKLHEGAYDAVILAAAGLRRARLYDAQSMTLLDDPGVLLPAPGQGALALQCRKDDTTTQAILATLHDAQTAECVHAEREIVRALDGDCHSPIAAHAAIEHNNNAGQFVLNVAVGARDGVPPVLRVRAVSAWAERASALADVRLQLEQRGARNMLHAST